MGVAQKTMFSISDRLARFFGKSGAPMEHNATAKSKQTFFYKLGINGPGLIRHFYGNKLYKKQGSTSTNTGSQVPAIISIPVPSRPW